MHVDQLKDLCREQQRCAIAFEQADKDALVQYLYDPEWYVCNMKRRYHFEVDCENETTCFPDGLDQRDMDLYFRRSKQFDPQRYVMHDGVIVRRMAYIYELIGRDVPDKFLDNKWEYEMIERRNQRKRRLSNGEDLKKAA